MPDTNNLDSGPEEDAAQPWRLRLYVVDDTPRTKLAIDNLKRICEEHLPGRFEIEVIDIQANPEAAFREGIVATPTVMRDHPLPARTLIGTLSDTARTLERLDLAAVGSGSRQSAVTSDQ